MSETTPADSVTLNNPVAHHFSTFIVHNANLREEAALLRLGRVAPRAAKRLIEKAKGMEGEAIDIAWRAACERHDATLMVREGSAKGAHIVICGAGPSLADHIAEYAPQADQLWGCNSAMPWLLAQGYRATHGFSIDQTPMMLAEWATAPDVEYLVATTVHPHLVEYLLGKGREIRFFHNYVGIPGPPVTAPDGTTYCFEDWMYSALFPSCIRAGVGLNAVPRAIDVARYMGAARITVLGADCALRLTAPKPDADMGSPERQAWLRDHTVMHADGGSALASGATPITFGGVIDGRHWETKPDLVITAQALREMADLDPERIHLIGDTLPNALKGQSREFLSRLPKLTNARGEVIPTIGQSEALRPRDEVLNSTA